ncbi:F0F1 ATP synthase subunit B [Flavobacteriaceae bacterium]|jgi:F-type H+-transporting ATPase subunit b|nr:ATP synthase F0 subunit B [uncultured bacterium]MDA9251091.1 F0F1 ATP synthase subunit B [Flavobacteriaceae bacterium]|tara:strand:- start:3016 stop:3513 length:498 start_codon:yes stop_codon:yes gene_type:complete
MEKLISEFSFGLFFWQLFIFIGLILLLKKFAWKPILDAVNERETSIKDALSSADEARKEMASLQEDNQKILQEARAEREALLKEARTSGADLLAKAKEDAKLEADKILSQAQDAIQNEKRAAINELKNQVAQISLEIAEKVIEGELEDKDKQTSLVEKLLKDASL